jgi:hypothetical protein
MLWGPMNHLKHLTNVDRLPFSIAYTATLIGTIYYSTWVISVKTLIIIRVCFFLQVRSYLFTIIFVLLQIGALVW